MHGRGPISSMQKQASSPGAHLSTPCQAQPISNPALHVPGVPRRSSAPDLREGGAGHGVHQQHAGDEFPRLGKHITNPQGMCPVCRGSVRT